MIEIFYKSGTIPKRYIVSGTALVGYTLLYLLRTNLNITIIDMTSNKTFTDGNITTFQAAEFHWDSVQKGVVLSAFPCGYMFTFLGAFLIHKLGGATVFGGGMLLAAMLTMLYPVLARTHVLLFIFGRAVQGLFEGLATAGTVDVFARWSPPKERARLVSYCYLGSFLGSALNYPVSGYVAHHFGWPAVFYLTGTIALIWSLLWLIFVGNEPATDRFITETERCFLKDAIQTMSTENLIIPWRKIFSSKAVYALFNEFFTAAWTSSFVFYCLPLYIKDVNKFNVQEVGIITSIPLLCSVISHPFVAAGTDYLRSNLLSVGTVHRIFLFLGQSVAVLMLLIAALCGKFTISMICFCVLRIGFTFSETSYWVICMDMAGPYCGFVKAFCLTFLSLGNFLNHLVIGYLVPNHSEAEWNLYFIVVSLIGIYGVVIFVTFGSGDLQPWAVMPKHDTKSSETVGPAIHKAEQH